jgi:hypothetical protein
MDTIKKNFKECDRLFLEKAFNLEQVGKHNLLTNWIENSKKYEIDEIENIFLLRLQDRLLYRVDDWNEYELIEHFIGPLFSIIDLNTIQYGMFSERLLKAVIGEYELSGYPDAVVAKGRRAPEIPYFCFHEYKKEKEPLGDPAGQCLAAMLVAQELNDNQRPVYGVVVKGLLWSFMVLQNKQYVISEPYKAINQELDEIVKLLKHLKTIIEEYVTNDISKLKIGLSALN